MAEAHRDGIERVRAGVIFASSADGQKQYARWRQAAAPSRPGLVGAALESAVMNVARLFPDNVLRGTI